MKEYFYFIVSLCKFAISLVKKQLKKNKFDIVVENDCKHNFYTCPYRKTWLIINNFSESNKSFTKLHNQKSEIILSQMRIAPEKTAEALQLANETKLIFDKFNKSYKNFHENIAKEEE